MILPLIKKWRALMKRLMKDRRRIGEKIGKLVRVDEATSSMTRGHYARNCAKIDL